MRRGTVQFSVTSGVVMNRKEFFLVGLVVVLIGVYVIWFTDWFRAKVLHIEHSQRSLREAWSGNRRLDPSGRQTLGNVTFSLHPKCRLTEIKVVPLAEYRTNKYARALWELVSPSGSPPMEGFAYGLPVAGMQPAQPGLEPEPLTPGVEYRLVVKAGKLTGEHDFNLGGSPAAGP